MKNRCGTGADVPMKVVFFHVIYSVSHDTSLIESKPLELGAIYNTRCSKCGGSGHIASECFNTGDIKYELIPEDEPLVPEKPRPVVGRGRGAVMPAWMNEESKLGSKKRRTTDNIDDRDRKASKKSKSKKVKKEKKEKKSKSEKKRDKKKHHKSSCHRSSSSSRSRSRSYSSGR